MTWYFKVNSFTDSTQNGGTHELVARGGRNTNNLTPINSLPEECEGYITKAQ